MPKLTTADISIRTKKAHKGKVQLIGNFINWTKKCKFKCLVCTNTWNAKPQHVSSGSTGCPKCGKKKAAQSIRGRSNIIKGKPELWLKRLKVLLRKFPSLRWESKNNPPLWGKSLCSFSCRTCKHQWTNRLDFFLGTKSGCPKCGVKNRSYRLSDSEVQKYLKTETRGLTSLHSNWKGEGEPRKYKCNRCKRVWKVLGNKRINQSMFCPRGCKHPRKNGYSNISLVWLKHMAKTLGIRILHAEKDGEFVIPTTRYRVDGFSPKYNLVFEFYGDACHGNPDVYKPHDRPNYWSSKTARRLYMETLEREKKIKSLGYTVISIWENDFRKQIESSDGF